MLVVIPLAIFLEDRLPSLTESTAAISIASVGQANSGSGAVSGSISQGDEIATASPANKSNANPEPEIIVTGSTSDRREDPLFKANQTSFAAVQKVDAAVVRPVSLAYKHGLPKPVRNGLHNFLENLHQPDVAINFLLQLKPGKAIETIARFGINTTIGIAGLFDIAKRKPFNLPDRPNGLADTLGYYGVKPGPFLYLPLLGPTTVRDLFGLAIDRSLLPLAVGSPFTKPAYNITSGTIKALDHRIRFDEQFQARSASDNPYDSMRALYLDSREREIAALHSHHQREDKTSNAETNRSVTGTPSQKSPKSGKRKMQYIPPISVFPI